MMTLSAACRAILGPASDRIEAQQGLRWAVVAAMAAARTSDDPEALRTLREHAVGQVDE